MEGVPNFCYPYSIKQVLLSGRAANNKNKEKKGLKKKE
jgi:hypothetical protein